MRTPLHITYCSVVKSFWNFAQSTAVILPCSVQNFKMIWRLKGMLWTDNFSQDLSFRRVSDGYPILQQLRGRVTVYWLKCVLTEISCQNDNAAGQHANETESQWIFFMPYPLCCHGICKNFIVTASTLMNGNTFLFLFFNVGHCNS